MKYIKSLQSDNIAMHVFYRKSDARDFDLMRAHELVKSMTIDCDTVYTVAQLVADRITIAAAGGKLENTNSVY